MATMIDTLTALPFLEKFAASSVLIAGLGREGWSTYTFLRHHLPAEQKIWIADTKSQEALEEHWFSALVEDANLEFIQLQKDARPLSATGTPLPTTLSFDYIFRSPGIHPQAISTTYKLDYRQLTSNTELFFEAIEFLNSQAKPATASKFAPLPWVHPLTLIGITGTKGKSTTAHLTHHLLKSCGFQTVLGGNIGEPALNLLDTLSTSDEPIFVVLELSSHQCFTLKSSPHVAVLQAISPEHLDYYANYAEYVRAKGQLVVHQTPQDILLYNQDSTQTADLALMSKARKVSLGTTANPDIAVSLDTIDLNLAPTDQPSLTVGLQHFVLKGLHNRVNVAAGVWLCIMLGVATKTIEDQLATLTPLAHRLETVAHSGGIEYINDSLSTTPEATKAALEIFKDQPVVLIFGGYDRGLEFAEFCEYLYSFPLVGLVVFPPSGTRFLTEFKDFSPTDELPFPTAITTDMPTAVAKAREWLTTKKDGGDTQKPAVVLLSPGSPSFGLFKDYAQRGERFSEAAKE